MLSPAPGGFARSAGAAVRHGAWTLPVLAVALADAVLRHQQAKYWDARDWAFYAVSCLFALAWVRLVAWGIAAWRARQRWLWMGAFLPLGALSAFLFASHLNHYRYFGVHPDVVALGHMFKEPRETLLIVRDSITVPVRFALAGLTVLFGLGWALAVSAFPWQVPPHPGWRRSGTWVTLGIAVLLIPAFRNNVPMAQGNFLPSVGLVFSTDAALEAFLSGAGEFRRLQVGQRPVLPPQGEPPPFNVLIVIAESLRADNVGYNGYARNTTPNVSAFFKQRPQRIVNFAHCYTNSIHTDESVPSLFTGVHPLQDYLLMHRAPLLFQYGKMFRGSYSFLLSAQSYEVANFRFFFQSADLDQFYYQEISGHPRYNNTGMDDHHLLPPLKEILQGLPPQVHFFGILHLMGNHYPYTVPPEFAKWGPPDALTDYDNSILYGDDFMGQALALLDQSHRLDDTLIFFTSDHGEAFGEHGVSGHRRGFYEEMIHIPCWMHVPKTVPAAQRAALLTNRQRNVSNLDLVPTLIDLLDLDEVPKVRDALENMWGSSLAKPVPPQRVIVAINGTNPAQLDEGFAIVQGTGRLQYFGSEQRVHFEVTDLARDPGQNHNLWGTLSKQEQAQWRRTIGGYPVLERALQPLLNAAGPPR